MDAERGRWIYAYERLVLPVKIHAPSAMQINKAVSGWRKSASPRAIGCVVWAVACHDVSLPEFFEGTGGAGGSAHAGSGSASTRTNSQSSAAVPRSAGGTGVQPDTETNGGASCSAGCANFPSGGGSPESANGGAGGRDIGSTDEQTGGTAFFTLKPTSVPPSPGGGGVSAASASTVQIGVGAGTTGGGNAGSGGSVAGYAGSSGGTAATTTATSGVGGADDEGVPARQRQSDWILMNDGTELGKYAGVGVCFYAAPRLATDGETVYCPKQTSAEKDCAGNVPTSDSLVDLRRRVELAVLDTWQRLSNLEIFVWQQCEVNTTTHMVHDAELVDWLGISFATVDRADRVGRAVGGPTVIYVDWRKIANHDYSGLLHEFGHALGYADEWLKPGYHAPAGCDVPSGHPQLGFTNQAFLDQDGIMGACFEQHHDPLLSPGDVALTQRVYGLHPNGALVGYPGQCLIAAGTKAIQFPCRGDAAESWHFDIASAALRVQTTISGTKEIRCLGLLGGSLSETANTGVELQVCDGRSGQTMAFANTQWKAFGTHCIEGTASGLVNRPCSSRSNQFWRFLDSDANDALEWDQIQLEGTNECVTSANKPDGTAELTLATCDSNDPNQSFEYPGNGLIVQGTRCVNLPSNVAATGLALVLSNACDTQPFAFGARFHLTTEIRNQGQCLSWSAKLGDPAQARFGTCSPWNTVPQQSWDYQLDH